MKRSFNVNLSGVTFCFDEDALGMLEKFIDRVTEYYKCKGEDLKVAEVEEAVATKLKARVGVDGIVTIEIIKVVLDEAGLPFDTKDCEEEAQGGAQTDSPNQDNEKASSTASGADDAPWRAAMLLGCKLFRDPYDQFVGGVLAGMAKYHGWGVALTRVLFVLLFLMGSFLGGGIGFLLLALYCISWVIIPRARSIMDITRMRKLLGREYSANGIEAAWRENYNIAMAELAAPKNNGCLAAAIKILFFTLLFVVGVPALFVLALLLFVIVVVLLALFATLGEAVFSNIYVIILLLLPLFAFVHWILKKCGVCRPLNIYIKLTIIVGWLVTLILAGYKIHSLVENNGGWEKMQQYMIDKRYLDEDFWEDIIRKNIEQAQSSVYVAWDDANLPFVIDTKMFDSYDSDGKLHIRFIDRDQWRGGLGNTENREFDAAYLDVSLWGDSVGDIRFVWDSIANELLVGLDATIGASMNLNSATDGVQLRYLMPSDTVQYGNAESMGKFPFEIKFLSSNKPQLFIGGNDTIKGLLISPVASRYFLHRKFHISSDDDEDKDVAPSDTL